MTVFLKYEDLAAAALIKRHSIGESYVTYKMLQDYSYEVVKLFTEQFDGDIVPLLYKGYLEKFQKDCSNMFVFFDNGMICLRNTYDDNDLWIYLLTILPKSLYSCLMDNSTTKVLEQ